MHMSADPCIFKRICMQLSWHNWHTYSLHIGKFIVSEEFLTFDVSLYIVLYDFEYLQKLWTLFFNAT